MHMNKRLRTTYRTVSLLLSCTLSTSVAFSSPVPHDTHPAGYSSAEADTKRQLTIAIRPDVEPYVSGEGTTGLEIEIVKAVFDKTNYKPDFVQLPRMRMIQTFNANSVEGVLTSNVALDGAGCITDWYIQHQNVGITLSERSFTISNLDDVANLSIITFDGATRYLGPDFANQAKKSPRYIESSDQNIHVSLLYQGYFDAAIGDEWILKLAQVNQKQNSGAFQPLTIHRILPTTYYAARFHDTAICRAFNDGLGSIRQDGTYEQIVRHHTDRISAKIMEYENEFASASPTNKQTRD